MSEAIRGSCLCGGVAYTVTGSVRDIIACHCTQCRKQSGHYYAAASAAEDQFDISDKGGGLKWYRSSEWSQRGFCRHCGSTLFWKMNDGGEMSFLAGSIDGPTNLKVARHIFTAYKGDYYKIDNDERQYPELP